LPAAWAALTARGLTNHPKNNQQKKKHLEISMAAQPKHQLPHSSFS
jgi:hypothetical protein